MEIDVNQFEKVLGYEFTNKDLLKEALTHSSFSNENGQQIRNNERMEFLGDAVLEIMVSHYLYKRFNTYPEGKLTRLRSKVVCEDVLYSISMQYRLGDFLVLGKGEEHTGGRNRKSILADCLEALIASVYLDSGFENVEALFLPKFQEFIERAATGKIRLDFKTRFQEVIQKDHPNSKIRYQVYREEGPDHDKTFYVRLFLDQNRVGNGEGKSKKSAEQEAAREALVTMGYINA
ncbi:MAG: Ribonuclease III [Clostridiales bacterium 38_11]|nr:MAG: Ribonuclease III [Clostridiales bacterium 38_11]HBH12123.1 ribonuclease III [Clostridiales bacterium]